MPTGEQLHFGPVPGNLGTIETEPRYRDLVQEMRAIADREGGEIAPDFRLMRRVGGYNINTINPAGHNGEPLVGSEGTLAAFRQVELKRTVSQPTRSWASAISQPSSRRWTRPSYRHLEAARGRLIDRNMIELAGKFRSSNR